MRRLEPKMGTHDDGATSADDGTTEAPTEEVAEELELTDDDIAAIAPFISSLVDETVPVAITLELMDFENIPYEEARKLISDMADDVTSACNVHQDGVVNNPSGVLEAGTSFFVLVEFAKDMKKADIFPDGFVPTTELAEKIVAVHFRKIAARALPTS